MGNVDSPPFYTIVQPGDRKWLLSHMVGIGGYYEKSDIIVSGAVYDGYDWL